KNIVIYKEYSKILLEEYAKNPKSPKGVIPMVINKVFPKYITLTRDDSYVISGYECGMHGDLGTKGSRGSLKNFRKLNIKSITGHSHTSGRLDNALSVGTSTVYRMGYNK